MFMENIEVRRIFLNLPRERMEVEKFLESHGLKLEEDVEYTIGLYHKDKIIGTGSISDRVLKCIAIDQDYQGQGLSNRIVSLLIDEEFDRGNIHLFLYTKPENIAMFIDMGFYLIAALEQVALLENDSKGIQKYVEGLSKSKVKGELISSIVMNCNPFTLGHQYLIEKASENSDVLHVFILWEDKSLFPNDLRLKLVEEGTNHLSNVIIHKAEDYVISNSTFPTYFLKEASDIVKIQASLDLKIFGEFIAPALGINRRYIGQEPYSPTTNEYNLAMKEILPNYGIEVIEIPRLEKDNIAISASRVRELLKKEDFDGLRNIVPQTTYDYLVSDEAKQIVERIKKADSRH